MKKYILLILIFVIFLLSGCDNIIGLGDKVDLDPPVVSIGTYEDGTAIASGDYVRGTITLRGSASDDTGIDSVSVSVNGSSNINATVSGSSWSCSIDTTAYEDGEKEIIILVTDIAPTPRTDETRLLLYFDNTPPVVMVKEPVGYATTSYTDNFFSIKGEASDPFRIRSVDVQLTSGAGTISDMEGTNSWSCIFDNTGVAGAYVFLVTAEDFAGNVSEHFYHYDDVYAANNDVYITPEDVYSVENGTDTANLTGIELASIEMSEMTLAVNLDLDKPVIEISNPDPDKTASENVMSSTVKFIGSVSDDDGVDLGSLEIRFDGGSWISVDTVTGDSTGRFATWEHSETYGSSGDHYFQLRVDDTEVESSESEIVYFSVDLLAASMEIASPAMGDYVNSADFSLSGSASDDTQITNMQISLDNGATWDDVTPSAALPQANVNWSYNASSVSEGSVNVRTRASDNDGGTWIYSNIQITVDTSDPVSSFTSPSDGSYVNGEVVLYGACTDNTQLESVRLKVGDNGVRPWVDIPSDELYNWTYTIDSADYENGTDGTETYGGSGVYAVNCYIEATDKAGNVSTTAAGDYVLNIDNALDNPVVSILSPQDDASLGGSVLVTGTSSDDDGEVYGVYMRLDVNTAFGDTPDFSDTVNIGVVGIDFDGTGGNAAVTDIDESEWYLVEGKAPWSVTLNTHSQLYDTDGAGSHSGDIHIQVKAWDKGGESDTDAVESDVEDLHFRFDDTIPLIENLTPVTDSYVNGTINITADVSDETQIKHLEISYDGGTNYEYIIMDGVEQPDYDTGASSISTTYSMDVNLDTTDAASGVGAVVSDDISIRIKVTDDTNYQSQESLVYYVDNRLPSVWMTQDTSDIFGSGDDALFYGYADDTGVVSGVDKVILYIEKDGNFYDPKDGSSTAVTTEMINGTSESFPSDTDYHMVIDSTVETLSGGNSDGDGLSEELNIGSYYEWIGRIDSTNLPDGVSTLHFVVYDKAGNRKHNSNSNFFVKNDKPEISSVTMGYDLNDDGSVQGGETFTYNGEFKARSLLYFDISTSDGGGISQYRVYEGSNISGTQVLAAQSGTVDISPLSEGPHTYFVQITDTDGITADRLIEVDVDNVDDDAPAVTLDPLAQDSVVDGHLEMAGTSLYNGTDADVSGTIMFTGEVSDDQGIEEFRVLLDGDTVTLASWTGGFFVSQDPGFVIDSQTFDPGTGHIIEWTYTWDSSTVNGVVAENISAQFTADDFAPNTHSQSTSFDVVPYISSIQTTQLGEGGIKDKNIRSVEGKYSVKSGSSVSDFITINGYNLDPIANGVRISSSTYKSGLNGTILVGNSLAIDTVAADYTTLTVSNDSDASGYLTVVGGTALAPIPSINNMNTSTVYNTETLSESGHTSLSDDRYITFFDVTSTSFDSSYYSNMMMEGDDPVFGFIQGGASNDLQVRVSTSDSASTGLIRILAADQMAMARDDDGIYHYASVNSFSGGRLVYLYDEYSSYYGAQGGAIRPFWDTFSGNYSSQAGNNAIDLDSISYTPGLQLGRYLNLQMKAKGSSTTAGEYAQVYMAWYDNYTGEILFRNHRVGRAGGSESMYGSTTTNQDDVTGTSGDASRIVVTNEGSSYLSMGVTDDDVVIIVYYNEGTGYLNMVYSTSSVDRADTTTAITWSAPVVLNVPYLGWYVSMTVETDDDSGTDDPIHIAAYDTVNADLIYLSLDSYLDTEVEASRVDAINSVGIYTDIKVNNGIPYISYYNNSENGTRDSIKLAVLNDTYSGLETDGASLAGEFTGLWDVMTVPVNTAPHGGLSKFKKVNLGFNSSGDPVLGFSGDNIEYTIPLDEYVD